MLVLIKDHFLNLFLILQFLVAFDYYSYHYNELSFILYYLLWVVFLCIYFLRFRSSTEWLKASFFQILFLGTIYFSTETKVDHGLTSYYGISLIYLFVALSSFFKTKRVGDFNNYFAQIGFVFFLAQYFSAGIWKLKVLWHNYKLSGNFYDSLVLLSSEIFSYQRMFQESNRDILFHFSPESALVNLGLFGTILLQISSLLILFIFMKKFKFSYMILNTYVIFIILFHLSMIVIFDIWFLEQIALFVLISFGVNGFLNTRGIAFYEK